MYLTAQRVQAGDGTEEVHSFSYRHPSDFAWPGRHAHRLATTNPGERLRTGPHALPLGGNRVRAYLDVLAPEGTPSNELVAGLEVLRRRLDELSNPGLVEEGRVSCVLGLEFALVPERDIVLHQLWDALHQLEPDRIPGA